MCYLQDIYKARHLLPVEHGGPKNRSGSNFALASMAAVRADLDVQFES